MTIKRYILLMLILGNLLFFAPAVFAHKKFRGYYHGYPSGYSYTSVYEPYAAPYYYPSQNYYLNYTDNDDDRYYYQPYYNERGERIRKAIKYGAIGAAIGYFLGR